MNRINLNYIKTKSNKAVEKQEEKEAGGKTQSVKQSSKKGYKKSTCETVEVYTSRNNGKTQTDDMAMNQYQNYFNAKASSSSINYLQDDTLQKSNAFDGNGIKGIVEAIKYDAVYNEYTLNFLDKIREANGKLPAINNSIFDMVITKNSTHEEWWQGYESKPGERKKKGYWERRHERKKELDKIIEKKQDQRKADEKYFQKKYFYRKNQIEGIEKYKENQELSSLASKPMQKIYQ